MIEPTTDPNNAVVPALPAYPGDAGAGIAEKAAETAADLYAQSERQSRRIRFERVLERAAVDA